MDQSIDELVAIMRGGLDSPKWVRTRIVDLFDVDGRAFVHVEVLPGTVDD